MRFLNTGPYPVEVAFCICPRDWARELALREVYEPFPESAGHVALFRAANGASFIVVSFSPEFHNLSVIQRIGCAVHEGTHVWQMILEHISETTPGSEAEACSVQWIAEWLLEQLQRVGWLKLKA